MSSHHSIDPGSIRADFLGIIKRFSSYLSSQKNSGIAFPKISQASEAIIQRWGNDNFTGAGFLCQGSEDAKVFIIDSEASFFNGETGGLLSRILAAMGLPVDAVMICNCDEPQAVKDKIRKILPDIIITLGENAGRILLGTGFSLADQHGKFHEFAGIKIMPTFHPSLLLEHPQFKRQVWEDMKLVMGFAGLKHVAQ